MTFLKLVADRLWLSSTRAAAAIAFTGSEDGTPWHPRAALTMTRMTITLPEEMTAFIEAQAAADGYASPSEYLCALIGEAQKRHARQELDSKLVDGIHSPASELTDTHWASLRQRIHERSPELRDRS